MPENVSPENAAENAAPAPIPAIPPIKDRAVLVIDCATAVVSVNLEMDFDAKSSGLINPRSPLIAQCLSNYGSRLVSLSSAQLVTEAERLAAALNPPPVSPTPETPEIPA